MAVTHCGQEFTEAAGCYFPASGPGRYVPAWNPHLDFSLAWPVFLYLQAPPILPGRGLGSPLDCVFASSPRSLATAGEALDADAAGLPKGSISTVCPLGAGSLQSDLPTVARTAPPTI